MQLNTKLSTYLKYFKIVTLSTSHRRELLKEQNIRLQKDKLFIHLCRSLNSINLKFSIFNHLLYYHKVTFKLFQFKLYLFRHLNFSHIKAFKLLALVPIPFNIAIMAIKEVFIIPILTKILSIHMALLISSKLSRMFRSLNRKNLKIKDFWKNYLNDQTYRKKQIDY